MVKQQYSCQWLTSAQYFLYHDQNTWRISRRKKCLCENSVRKTLAIFQWPHVSDVKYTQNFFFPETEVFLLGYASFVTYFNVLSKEMNWSVQLQSTSLWILHVAKKTLVDRFCLFQSEHIRNREKKHASVLNLYLIL